MKKTSFALWITYFFVFVGALNWGLIGVFDFNAVEWALQGPSTFTNTVYMIVGFSAIYLIIVQGHLYEGKKKGLFVKK